MIFTTRSRYGLRAMLDIALAGESSLVMAKDIAERQHLPVAYLEQLLGQLKRGGLISSLRGARGGYALARPAENITLADIVEALEGPLDISRCHEVPFCGASPGGCALRDILEDVNQAIRKTLGEVSLANFVRKQREKELVPEETSGAGALTPRP